MWLNLFREDFRKTYKEKHPNNKSVAVVSIVIGDFDFLICLFVFCYVLFIFSLVSDCLGRESWW